MLDITGETNMLNELEMVENQIALVSEYQNLVDSLSYNYGERWGPAESVTTLDDILSLSW